MVNPMALTMHLKISLKHLKVIQNLPLLKMLPHLLHITDPDETPFKDCNSLILHNMAVENEPEMLPPHMMEHLLLMTTMVLLYLRMMDHLNQGEWKLMLAKLNGFERQWNRRWLRSAKTNHH
jgi:hypothetical protein